MNKNNVLTGLIKGFAIVVISALTTFIALGLTYLKGVYIYPNMIDTNEGFVELLLTYGNISALFGACVGILIYKIKLNFIIKKSKKSNIKERV